MSKDPWTQRPRQLPGSNAPLRSGSSRISHVALASCLPGGGTRRLQTPVRQASRPASQLPVERGASASWGVESVVLSVTCCRITHPGGAGLVSRVRTRNTGLQAGPVVTGVGPGHALNHLLDKMSPAPPGLACPSRPLCLCTSDIWIWLMLDGQWWGAPPREQAVAPWCPRPGSGPGEAVALFWHQLFDGTFQILENQRDTCFSGPWAVPVPST